MDNSKGRHGSISDRNPSCNDDKKAKGFKDIPAKGFEAAQEGNANDKSPRTLGADEGGE